MKVVIIRHAEVGFDWSRECSSKGFDSDCNGYDNAPIKNITYKIPEIGFMRVYISELSRSLNTAEKLFPDGDYTETGLINEVPLRSSYDTNRKMPLWFWNLSGRIQWLVNSARQVEGRNKTKERARRFIATVSQEKMNCAVITHGFYMHTLLDEMKKAGFRTTRSSVGYNNGEYVIAEK